MIRPLGDRVVVRRGTADEKTAGGIFIPQQVRGITIEGDVVAVGPKVRDVTVGQRVVFKPFVGQEIDLDGESLLMLTGEDVVGVVQ